jgi:hypothetical protein
MFHRLGDAYTTLWQKYIPEASAIFKNIKKNTITYLYTWFHAFFVDAFTGARLIIRNPENKKLLTIFGYRFTTASTMIPAG